MVGGEGQSGATTIASSSAGARPRSPAARYPRWMFWKQRDGDRFMGYLYFLPAIVLVLIFKGYPLARGLYISFTRPKGVLHNEFAGLANYDRMLHDKAFLESLVNVLKGVATLPLFVMVPLILAFLIFTGVRGWRFFRATYFFSYTLAAVMVGYMFSFVLGIDGPLNEALRSIGLGQLAIQWFGTVQTAMWAVYAVVLWSWFGLGTVIYLAGLANVPEDYFDAAKVDGANWFQMFVHVTIPSVLPTMGYWSVLCTTGLLIWLFPFIYALTEGGPGYASMVPEYYIYLVATRFVDPGYASALGIALFALVFVISIFQVRLMYMQSGD